MRVLLVTHHYPEHRTGLEIAAGELATRLAARGVRVEWAASAATPEEELEIERLPMTAWHIVEKTLGFCYPLWGPLSLLRLSSAVRRCDVVHIHECIYVGSIVARICAFLFGKPVVVTQHVGSIELSSSLLRAVLGGANRVLGRLILGTAAHTVFISTKVLSYFSRLIPFRAPPRYIPNGVSEAVFREIAPAERRTLRTDSGWGDGQIVALFVGRMIERKGVGVLRTLAERFTDVEWVFVGGGPTDPREWNLQNVHAVGSLAPGEIVKYYQAADLLVLPSVSEGFPLVVQEAMACGTPALITHDTALGAPGVTDVAYVADATADGMAETIERVVRDRVTLEERRNAVARFARTEWSWDAAAQHYLTVFEELSGKSVAVSPTGERAPGPSRA